MSTQPTRETIAQFYPSEYVPRNLVIPQKHRRAAATLWHAYIRLFMYDTDLLEDLPPGRVLDVGTGSGEFFRMLRERGWEPVGVEPDHDTASLAAKGGMQVFQGEICDVDFPDRSFNAVTFRGSLEHMHNPLEALRRAYSLCRDDGVVV